MKICFLSPFRELSTLARSIIKERDLSIDVIEASLEECGNIIPGLKQKGYNSIITRGATVQLAKRLTDLPVISCNYDPFDIINALYKAKNLTETGKIGILINTTVRFDSVPFEQILGVEIVKGVFEENRHQLLEKMNSMLISGVDVIVGGRLTVSCCQEKGCKCVLIDSSASIVNAAIDQALQITHSRQQERMNTELLNQIINNVNFGILAFDENSKVILTNNTAIKLLNISVTDNLDVVLKRIVPISDLLEQSGLENRNLIRVRTVGKNKLLFSSYPIIVDNEIAGNIITLQNTDEIRAMEETIRADLYSKGLVARYNLGDYIGTSQQCQNVRQKVNKISNSDYTVLIIGETGTGKEILAQSIHVSSSRRNGPFVAINCSVFPENLLESELFGYEEGSFTGAKKGGSIGLFELAHKGTIFLDEIGELPSSVQAQLLRVIEERQIRKIGSNSITHIDVRIIAATNKNLLEAVKSGDFRKDLYYRLNVMSIHTFPLRERKEDIEDYTKYFLKKFNCQELYSPELVSMLQEYDWPGNVRELQNFFERLDLLKDDLSVRSIFNDFILESGAVKHNYSPENSVIIKKDTLHNMELSLIEAFYHMFNGNITKLAAELNVSRTTIWSKLKQSESRQKNNSK